MSASRPLHFLRFIRWRQPAREGSVSQTGTERERYEELLQELRVMLPGVEVLFAFLLTAVFANRFSDLDRLGIVLFVLSLTTSAITVLLLLMPAALHRLADIDRTERVRVATRFQMIGSITLGISMCLALFVVVRFIFSTPVAAWLVGTVAAMWASLWYLFPIWLSNRH